MFPWSLCALLSDNGERCSNATVVGWIPAASALAVRCLETPHGKCIIEVSVNCRHVEERSQRRTTEQESREVGGQRTKH